MMERITVQTSFDGTEMKASDLLPMATIKNMADEYHAQFHTQERYDWEQNHIKNGTLSEAREEALPMEHTNPVEARYRNSRLPAIESGIEQKKREEERAMRARQTATGRRGRNNVTDTQAVSDIISAWLQESDMVYGMPISGYTIDKEALYSVATPLLQNFVRNGDWQQAYRLMDMPQMNALRGSVSTSMANVLSSILPSDDGGVNSGSDPFVQSLVDACITNPNAVANTFGGDLAREAYTLKTLSGGDAGYAEALRLYALSNQTKKQNPDVHSANEAAAKDNMLGFTIDSVPHAGGGKDWADFGKSCNQFVASDMRRLWTTALDAGIDPERAQSLVNDCVRDNYETYHWGVFPRTAYANMNTDSDGHYFRKAMDSFIYSTCTGGDTSDYEGTTIGYNPITGVFTFTCNSLGRTKQITTNQLRRKAREIYKNDDAAAESSSDVPLSTDDINEQRSIPQWNNGDSYDDGSAWTGYEADPYID